MPKIKRATSDFMTFLRIAFIFTSALISSAYAQAPSMTIYGTFDRDPRSPSAEPESSQFRKVTLAPQSSVSIYGTIDGGVRHLTNATAAGSVTKIGSNGEYYNNRLGFKGTEDLGGGMNVHFHLETGFNTGTGALDNAEGRLFNRISSLGIAGPFGSIDFGRQPSVACKAVYAYDPFQYRYVHIIPLAGAVAGNIDGKVRSPYTKDDPRGKMYSFGTIDGPRLSNAVQYFGKFGGFTVSAEYAMGEVAGSNSNGSAKAAGLGYTDGTFTIGGAYTRQNPNVAATGAPDYREQDQITFGGAYKIGDIRIASGYINTTTETAATSQAQNIWLGARYDVTSIVSVTTGYYRTTLETSNREIARRNFFIIGATYALSSRTSLYADIDHTTLHGLVSFKAGEQIRQIGTSIGINHMF